MSVMKPEHFVSASCGGEKCGFSQLQTSVTGAFEPRYQACGEPATHKVGEEIPYDDPMPVRHNLTMYVCCHHFGQVFGWYARELCGIAVGGKKEGGK